MHVVDFESDPNSSPRLELGSAVDDHCVGQMSNHHLFGPKAQGQGNEWAWIVAYAFEWDIAERNYGLELFGRAKNGHDDLVAVIGEDLEQGAGVGG